MARRKFPPLRPEGTVDIIEACKLLDISRATFFKYAKEPDFPQPVQRGGGGRPTLYLKAAIEEWKRRRLEGTGHPVE